MWPSFNLDLEIIKTNILSKIHDDCFKNVTSRVVTRPSFDLAWWPSFWLQWPSFKPDLEIKTNILSKIHDDCFINVTARVLTGFYTDVARWPSFWPHMAQFRTWHRNHPDKHFEEDSWWLLQKCDRWSVNKVFCWFSRRPSFWPQVNQFKTWPRTHQDKHFEQDSWWLLQKCDC